MSSTEENSPATTPQENEPTAEQANPRDLEKIEEEKLKSKYPSGMRVPGGHSAFLQKRLQKGVGYLFLSVSSITILTSYSFHNLSKNSLILEIIKWQSKKVAVLSRCLPIR